MDEIKNNFVVYTALFGNYDDLIDPKQDYEGCDFICFTDRKDLKSDIWEIRIVEKIDLPLNMMNRKYKILPHLFLNEYEWSMYVDSNIKISSNPLYLAQKYLNEYDFVMPKHFARNCLYNEALECITLGKANYYQTTNQMKHYRTNGFPKNYGLGENNILLRNHNQAKIVKIMNDWWQELNLRTQRDQLSLGYVLWKNKSPFNYMQESARGNIYFKIKLHSLQKKKGIKGIIANSFYEYLGNNPRSKMITTLIYLNKLLKKLYIK